MISVIVLLEEQFRDFSEFVARLDALFAEAGKPYEILVLANATGNFCRSQLSAFNGRLQSVRAFEIGARTSQAVCLRAILNEARGDLLYIFGSYQQITDDSIRLLVDSVDETTDVVSPWRQNRVDPSFNQLQSQVFNWLVRMFVSLDLHDFSCTVKVCRREVLEETELYGNMFRFFPVIAATRGFRIKEIPVAHLQERGKTGFYDLSDYVARVIDIFTLFFLTRFTRKPLRFFSAVGLGFSFAGALVLAALFVQRFFFSIPIGNRPSLFLGLLFAVLGVLVSSAGLLGEIIAFTNGRHKKEYTIEKVIS